MSADDINTLSADDIVALLNHLIRVSLDERKGYADAAEYAQAPMLKNLFVLRSGECALAANELQFVVQTFGSEPLREDRAAARRGPIVLKSKPDTGLRNDNAAVLEQVERGEDRAQRAYAQALQTTLPPEVEGLVHKQYRAVRRNCRELRILRQHYPRAAA